MLMLLIVPTYDTVVVAFSEGLVVANVVAFPKILVVADVVVAFSN